ncbi:hypothetical protein ACWEV3_01165 [Saccharopolyspora sp. NPDC003752]
MTSQIDDRDVPPEPITSALGRDLYWAAIPDIDPAWLARGVRLLNGFRSWPHSDTDGIRYQLAHSTLELRNQEGREWLLVVDRTELAVKSTAARLGFSSEFQVHSRGCPLADGIVAPSHSVEVAK